MNTISPPPAGGVAGLPAADIARLPDAARDCRYLLARGYPRQAILTLVGNRYHLSQAGRAILQRGVFAPAAARQRRAKLVAVANLRGRSLAMDGHNVVITLECARRGLPLVAADDGFVRDIGRLSRAYRPSELTTAVLQDIAQYLAAHGVGPLTVYYDAPMSRSGELAALTRTILAASGLTGSAQAVPVPELRLLADGGVIASSDTDLIDRCSQVVDVAGEIIRQDDHDHLISLDFVGKELDSS